VRELTDEQALEASWSDVVVGVAKRRGVEIAAKQNPREVIHGQVRTMTPPQLAALIVELAATRGLYASWSGKERTAKLEAACRVVGVDYAGHVAAAREAAKTKAKKKPTRKRSAAAAAQ